MTLKKNEHSRLIKFTKSYTKDEDDIYMPNKDSKRVTNKFVRTYNSALTKLISLSSSSSKLITYMITVMSQDNVVRSGKVLKDNFDKFLISKMAEPMVQRTMDRAVKELLEKNLIIKAPDKQYLVNPEHFDSSTESRRSTKIQVMLEFLAGARNSPLMEDMWDRMNVSN